jgi:hypothetical protein
MDLIAEALVAEHFPYEYSDFVFAYNIGDSFKRVPDRFIFPEPVSPMSIERRKESRLGELDAMLSAHYLTTMEMPHNETDFANILGKAWTDLLDPWGQPYYLSFAQPRLIEIWSAGPDKLKNTADDFRAGIIPEGHINTIAPLIRAALNKQDYPATAEEFFDILRREGLAVDTWRGGRENSLRVEISTNRNVRRIIFFHDGRDHRLGISDGFRSDDFMIANLSGPYFTEETRRISEALINADSTPETVEEFEKVLLDAGIDLSGILDAWGRQYVITQTFDERQERRFFYRTTTIYGGYDYHMEGRPHCFHERWTHR